MVRPLVVVLALSSTIALADTVWLKNGGTIDGTVIQETADRVVIDIGGGKMTIQRSEIDRIEKTGKNEGPEPPRGEPPPAEPSKPPVDETPAPAPAEDEAEPGPKPSEVRIEKPEVRLSEGHLTLCMDLIQPEGHALRMRREECRVESWTDDRGGSYDVSTPDYFDGFTVLGDGPKEGAQIKIEGTPDAAVESFHVMGTFVYRLGWARREGRTKEVALTDRTELEIEGIPFTLLVREHPFATEEEARTKTWVELQCPYGELEGGDYVFLTELTFWDAGGQEIPSRNNQMSDWSDDKGNSGFFFTYELEGKPTEASIRYRLWARMKTMIVLFDLDAPIHR